MENYTQTQTQTHTQTHLFDLDFNERVKRIYKWNKMPNGMKKNQLHAISFVWCVCWWYESLRFYVKIKRVWFAQLRFVINDISMDIKSKA